MNLAELNTKIVNAFWNTQTLNSIKYNTNVYVVTIIIKASLMKP